MEIRPIVTDEDHAAALKEIDRLWGVEMGTPDGDYFDALVTLVEAYEEKRWPMPELDPVQHIFGHMDLTGRTQADLAKLLGSRSRASEILNRKRALTVDMIHRLQSEWGIPAKLLVQPYKLDAA